MRFFAPICLLTFVIPAAASNAQVLQPFRGRFVAESEPVEKRPWVGVSVSPAPASLRHQLKVTEGVGLVVEFVQPKSPAADAGLKPFDLLVKLDDQWLINPEQFAVLIRMHRAGDEVKLTFLREGSEETVPVTLIEHAAPRLPEWDGGFAWPVPPPPAHPSKPDGAPLAQSVFTWVDGSRQMSVTTTNGHRMLLVKENDTGKVLFNGPIDTEQQRAKLSPQVRHELDVMNRLTSQFEARQGSGASERPAPTDRPTRQSTEPRRSQEQAAPAGDPAH